MRTTSKLSPKAYLTALKQRMSSHMAWGQGRFTGFFLGSLFTVTRHMPYQWTDMRANVKCTALGYVKNTPEGSQAHYICLHSYLAPTQFLFAYVCLWLLSSAIMLASGLDALGACALVCLVAMAVIAPISAFFESRMEKGHEAKAQLMGMVMNPEASLF